MIANGPIREKLCGIIYFQILRNCQSWCFDLHFKPGTRARETRTTLNNMRKSAGNQETTTITKTLKHGHVSQEKIKVNNWRKKKLTRNMGIKSLSSSFSPEIGSVISSVRNEVLEILPGRIIL